MLSVGPAIRMFLMPTTNEPKREKNIDEIFASRRSRIETCGIGSASSIPLRFYSNHQFSLYNNKSVQKHGRK